MTVLTFPTTGSKSDKEPLVDHEAATAAAIDRLPASGEKQQPPFDPKRLESGGDVEPLRRANLREKHRKRLQSIRCMLILLLVLAALMSIVSFSLFPLVCFNALADNKKQHHDAVAMPHNAQTDDAAAAASAPCRSFTSYEAAEKDLAQLQQMRASATEQPQDDYDTAALQFNTVQVSSAGGGGGEENPPVGGGGGFKRLEEYAIHKAIVYSKKILDGIAVANANIANGGVVESTAPDSAVVAGVPSPPVTMTKSARFIHDFSINITGIVDPEGQRCFVMSLVRNDITAPSSLDDLLDKMTTGYYSSDLSKILNEMRIVKPALNLTQADYGLYISRDCADYPTYKLEKKVISTTTSTTTTSTTTTSTTTTTTTAAATQPAVDATTVVTLV